MSKSAKQIASVSLSDVTLLAECNLHYVDAKGFSGNYKEISPMEIFDKYSRFKLTMIKTFDDGTKKPVSANISIEDAFYINKVVEGLIQDLTKEQASNKQESIAYTYHFKMGKLKDKTPAEVALSEGGVDILNEQYKWLKENIQKFPKNKEAMEAIAEAGRLHKEGKLSKDSVANVITIMDVLKVPFADKVDERGLTNVVTYSIKFDKSADSPFIVNIMNCMAPPIKDGSPLTKVQLKNAQDKVESEIKLSARAFFGFINTIKRCAENFERSGFVQQDKIADEIERKARENAKAEG